MAINPGESPPFLHTPNSIDAMNNPTTREPIAAGMLGNAVQGAHDTIDRLAVAAAPAVHQLGERVIAAEDALHAKAEQMRDTRDAWAQSLRTTVREKPLACVAAAFALGAVIARMTR